MSFEIIVKDDVVSTIAGNSTSCDPAGSLGEWCAFCGRRCYWGNDHEKLDVCGTILLSEIHAIRGDTKVFARGEVERL